MNNREQIDEVLEKLWECLEETPGAEEIDGTALEEETGMSLDRLLLEGVVEKSGRTLRLTAAGREEAAQAIRRHRLSERLFHDIIETDPAEMEEAACRVEHIVKRGTEEKICRLLGHPETCPHGKPIPPGECCRKARASGERFIAPLSRLKPGERGTIAYIKTGDSKKLQKLMAMGVLPGNAVELNADFPSFVFSVGYSQYAVDAGMAATIIIKRVDWKK